jgi:TolB-like protein/Tfp pilus assembly protein PilF/predicted Ser/Thr protein kinase
MNAQRWHEISRLFHEALDIAAGERAIFLEKACRGDHALRVEVESLLADEASAEAFLRSRPEASVEREAYATGSKPGALPAPGGALGSYRIERQLGRGGMGAVFLAYDTKLHRRIALKVLEGVATVDAAGRRLLHEARNAAALNHPNICTIHEVGGADGTTFIAMEYVEGRSLRERLDEGALPPSDVLSFGIQAADALGYAHDHDVVHRDFKAANAIVTDAGRLKIVDFGLAKRGDVMIADATSMTAVPTGAAAGTPATMAPEQVRGDATDARTDLWALGVLLYQMVSGTNPFRAPTIPELFSAILRDAPAPVPDTVPAELKGIIERCLEKDPARRFQRAAEVRAALEAIQPFTVAPPPKMRHGRTRRGLAATAALAGLGMLAVAMNIGGLRTHLTGGTPRSAFDSLAVLPLESLSASGEQDYFAAGMHEALILGLGKLRGLQRVSARPSVLRYRTADKPLRQIADELGVGALITGTVLHSGSKVRITAHLIDPVTERQLWAESYEREVRDVLALQNEVVAAIARQVQLQLSPDERNALAHARQVNPEAYQAYLKGKFQLNKLTPEGFEKGMALLREAVALDPAEPLAYAGLARGYSLMEVFSPASSPEDASRAKAAAFKAIELDDMLAEAHAALATVKFAKEWDYAGAEEGFRRALQINQNLAEVHITFAQYLSIFGSEAEAIAEWKRGIQLDPLSPLYAAWFGGAYWEFGRFDEAITEAHKALELQPDFPVALVVLGLAHLDKGQREEAIAAHEKLLEKYPHQGNSWILARTYALAGRSAEARRMLTGVQAKPPSDLVHPWFVAAAYSALGEHEEAMNWLEKAYDLRIGFLTNLARERAACFDLRPLRTNARFQTLLKKMNLERKGDQSRADVFNSRFNHVRASRQSRAMVSGETWRISAVSSTVRPAK